MSWTTCPLCDGTLSVPRALKVEDTLFCPRCDCLLQVVSLEPLEVDFPYKWNQAAEEPRRGKRPERAPRPK